MADIVFVWVHGVVVMREIGIDIPYQKTTALTDVLGPEVGLVAGLKKHVADLIARLS